MFENLKNAVIAEQEKRLSEALEYIENGFCESWRADEKIKSDNGIRRYSTDLRWKQYTDGEISREKAVALATARAKKAAEKRIAEALEKIESVAAAGDLEEVTVSVEWAKSRLWGYNPTATVCTFPAGRRSVGRASGCGYDKESAAIAAALNDQKSVLKVLYSMAESAIEAGKSYRDFIGYGSGYSAIPYFEGGVGSSCFWSIFDRAGYRARSTGSGKTFDCWTITKK